MRKTSGALLVLLPLAALLACGSESADTPSRKANAADDAGTVSVADAAAEASRLDASGPDAGDGGRPDASDGGGATDSTDGVCNPSVVTSGVFDPDCVYIVGSLLPGSAGWDVIMHPSTPAVYAHGFGDHFSSPTLRPKDGRMQWRTFDALYMFQPDTGAVNTATSVVLANDDKVATPGCTEGVAHGFIFPDDSVSAYQCFSSANHPGFAQHLFVEGQSSPLASGGTDINPIAVGGDRSVLFRKVGGGPSSLAVFDGKTMHTVADPGPSVELPAVRYRSGAFLVAVQRSFSPDQIDLMRVTANGSFTKLGSYQLGVPDTVYNECVLDPGGDMYCFTEQLALHDKVRRFSISAPPQIIYDPTGKAVQLHIPYLVTGP